MTKPSDIICLIPSFRKFLPPKNFYALMMFGKIFINIKNQDKYYDNEKKGNNAYLKNHEMIHVQQAIKIHNSWILYYLLYIWFWLKNLPFIFDLDFAYKFIPFEMEAYYYEKDFTYTEIHRNGTDNYKFFNKFTLKEKRSLYKQYLSMKKEKFITFHDFLISKIKF